ncbi:VanZ family protein [Clostridium tagluense]|uniref:VanZ family protein n=1 Tax=Clostridium tagluense TaxID=360422 RepID=UPI001CF4FE18|nr:VanZ family protein [Clostridium tagluense]MCB2313699.1 VanZ family protein [Clostridium tagluense]MCB2318549.1 VanZ family protein [Clostridium tagluense]MCB2323361.1 VanZ family protein [Clostridium tagluense]MCB2328346.1 VanZ family protein [Clostridium tagluense]MCB2333192.1 VanZ family protein [Clostridium tagluense]
MFLNNLYFNNLFKALLYSFLFTLGIETIQLLSYYVGNRGRSLDIDDIILNTFGAWVGYMFYKKIVLKLINKQFLDGIHINVDCCK